MSGADVLRIRAAGPGDAVWVAGLLAVAMRETEIAHWLVPDPDERRRVYAGYFDLVVPWFLQHGVVRGFGPGSAVLVQVTCPGRFAPDIDGYDDRLAEVCGPAAGRFRELDAAMHVRHPGFAHEYLAFLAVHPELQGGGLGSALLRDLRDRTRLPVHLEATGPRNSDLYARHGYRPGRAYPAGAGGPPLYPMTLPERT
jgi:ribosomal protein S18 acetylase RimI-like enzyme